MAYNPSNQLPISKGLGTTGNFPTAGKYEFYYGGDGGLFVYRPYVSVAEIGTHIPSIFRRKGDVFLVNSGGTLDSGTGIITGGTNTEYWYKDDTTTPVAKSAGGGGGAVSIGEVYVEDFRESGEGDMSDVNAINRAIASLSGGAGMVVLDPRKTYNLYNSIRFAGNGQILNGKGSFLKTNDKNYDAIVNSYNSCEIWNINFQSTNVASTEFEGAGISLIATDRAKILNCTFDRL